MTVTSLSLFTGTKENRARLNPLLIFVVIKQSYTPEENGNKILEGEIKFISIFCIKQFEKQSDTDCSNTD